MNKTTKKIPILFMTKAKKTVVFINAKSLIISNNKYTKIAKSAPAGVMMLVFNQTLSTYTILKEGKNFHETSSILLNASAENLTKAMFVRGMLIILPPPSKVLFITTQAGLRVIEYTINKYSKLQKRNYIGLEDMLWNIPDEIKNRITVLNFKKRKKETVFDIEDMDQKSNRKDVFTKIKNNKKTILDY